jgi:GLPGLI family protein
MNFKSLKPITSVFCVVFFLAFTINVTAQTKLTILYKQGNIKTSLSEYLKPNNTIKWSGNYSIAEFTISDSITFFETLETYDEKDEFSMKTLLRGRKNKVRGKAFSPNASYCNYIKGISLNQIEWKDENYLVKDVISNKQEDWVLSEEIRTIFGYPCKQAYIRNGEEIERVVWYTENFKCNYSASGDTTIPGTILETYYPKTGKLVTAIDLQIEVNAIMVPKVGILVTRDAFDKIKKNKKS